MELKSIVDKFIFLLILFIVWIVISNKIERKNFRINLKSINKYVKKTFKFLYNLFFTSKIENFNDDDTNWFDYVENLFDGKANIESSKLQITHENFYNFIKDVYQEKVKNAKNKSNSDKNVEWNMWKNKTWRNEQKNLYESSKDTFYKKIEITFDLKEEFGGTFNELNVPDKIIIYHVDGTFKSSDLEDDIDNNKIKLFRDGVDLKYQIKNGNASEQSVRNKTERYLGMSSVEYFENLMETLIFEINDLNSQIAHLQKVSAL